MPRAVPSRPGPRRLFVGAAIGLVSAVALCSAAFSAYLSSARWMDRTVELRQEWLTSLLDAETAARSTIAAGPLGSPAPYDSALLTERAKASLLRDMVVDDPRQLQNVGNAERDAQALIDAMTGLVALAKAGHRDEALARLADDGGLQRLGGFRADLRTIRDEEDRRLEERRHRARSWGLAALLGSLLPAVVAFALLVLAWRREGLHDRTVTRLAADARRRLTSLTDLAGALAQVRTRSEVAKVVVDHGVRAAGADTCTLYQLDETGKALELLGDRGVAANVLDKIRRIDETSGNPATFATFQSGVSTWVENEAEYEKVYPQLATVKADGPRAKAFWSVPLLAEGRPLGLLGVGFYAPRAFSDDERTFVDTLAKLCAQALLRASRREREDEARRWLSTTLRSIGDAVIATDAEGRVTFMNHVAETLTDWTEADARGRPLDDVFCIFSEHSRAVVESPVAKVLREGKIVGLANHTVLRSKCGEEVPIDDSGAPIRNEDGSILGVVLVFRDVTEEKRGRARAEFLAKAGEALAASNHYESTLATVAQLATPALADWCAVELLEPGATASRQVAVAHVDEHKVRFARELGERYPPDPTARTGTPEVIRTGRSELYTEIPRELLEGSAVDAEHLRMIRDLQLRSAMVVPLRVRGRTFGAMTFVYAESGRRYTEDDLAFAEDFAGRAAMAIENALALKETAEAAARERVLRAEAELANRAKDEFLATVSHELRTPLNAILGWTVTLRRRKPLDDVDRALAIVERNARVQTKLIEDVLDISRIISGKLVLNLGPTNVSEAVSAAIETVAPAAEGKSIQTSIEVADSSLTITADADRLQQIVWNLLSNAVKFTPKGGAVRLRAYRDGSDVCICVSDTGEGIRGDALPRVFERFHQADASTTRRHGGLGLGLAIVKQLVSAHGGTVTADSDGEGKGATFVVRLPARSAVAAVSRGGRPAAALPVPAAGLVEAPRLDGLRILVVDDEEDARGLVSEVLREQGAEVHVAGSAREALEQLGTVKPDVVVSDIGMPETDGLSLIRKIRSLPSEQGGRTPAVALTAYARVEDAQRAFAAGYQRHVPKPVEALQLATVVANLGGRSLGGV
jgi:PAS domain S-box-containing protein